MDARSEAWLRQQNEVWGSDDTWTGTLTAIRDEEAATIHNVSVMMGRGDDARAIVHDVETCLLANVANSGPNGPDVAERVLARNNGNRAAIEADVASAMEHGAPAHSIAWTITNWTLRGIGLSE